MWLQPLYFLRMAWGANTNRKAVFTQMRSHILPSPRHLRQFLLQNYQPDIITGMLKIRFAVPFITLSGNKSQTSFISYQPSKKLKKVWYRSTVTTNIQFWQGRRILQRNLSVTTTSSIKSIIYLVVYSLHRNVLPTLQSVPLMTNEPLYPITQDSSCHGQHTMPRNPWSFPTTSSA